MDGEEDFSNLMTEVNETGIVDEAPLSTTTRKNGPIISGEPLDIEAYTGLYTGRTKIKRLIFIASHYNNPAVQLEALRMAYDEIKKGENTQLYREVIQKIEGRLGPNYEMDTAWCSKIELKTEQRKETLESELNSYRAELRSLESLLNEAKSFSSEKGSGVSTISKEAADGMDSSAVTKKLEEELKKRDALIEMDDKFIRFKVETKAKDAETKAAMKKRKRNLRGEKQHVKQSMTTSKYRFET